VSFVEGISTNLVAAGLLAVLAYIASFWPQRLLWQMHNVRRPRDMTIYISFREPEQTRGYGMPVVGLGQVAALTYIIPSLTRAYWRRSRDLPQIVPGHESISIGQLTGNTVMIGGASRNEATKRLLERCEATLGVRQRHGDPQISGDRIFLRMADGSWEALGGTPVDGAPHAIEEDYGLIIRIPNPWDVDRKNKCVILCGVHTYGTAAAAHYFIRQRWKPTWWGKRGVMAIVRAEINKGHIVGIHKARFRRL
jgi:hypothetical protein